MEVEMKCSSALPVAVIGAGPVGMAAAARLLEAGMPPVVFEQGNSVGTALLEWGHVRVFSPWKYNIDDAARRLLDDNGWTSPPSDELPTGRDIVQDYLAPLSRISAIEKALRLGATVTAIARQGLDKVSSKNRADAPFVIRYRDDEGDHG
jgi:2-polyprenyl-6-methoxyphenol hydroxylase-like FAD-dependent oxidoreductase